MFVCLVCPSEFHSILFVILSEKLQIRLIKLDITSAISASETSFLSKSDNERTINSLLVSHFGTAFTVH